MEVSGADFMSTNKHAGNRPISQTKAGLALALSGFHLPFSIGGGIFLRYSNVADVRSLGEEFARDGGGGFPQTSPPLSKCAASCVLYRGDTVTDYEA